jgi:transcriptional regulator with XRE-family HTH domain
VSINKRTLREWRAFKNLGKQDMAVAMGIHPSTYAKWEAKPEDLRIREAVQVAGVLGCEVSEIIFFESNPKFSLETPEAVNV